MQHINTKYPLLLSVCVQQGLEHMQLICMYYPNAVQSCTCALVNTCTINYYVPRVCAKKQRKDYVCKHGTNKHQMQLVFCLKAKTGRAAFSAS